MIHVLGILDLIISLVTILRAGIASSEVHFYLEDKSIAMSGELREAHAWERDGLFKNLVLLINLHVEHTC